MLIPNNAIIIWTGTAASIPSGFVRVTDLDGRFVKGIEDSLTTPGSTGGSATHTHSSPSHSHTISSHSHSGVTSTTGTYADNTNNTSDPQIMTGNHYHNWWTDSTSAGTTGSTAITYGSVSNDPPYRKVIFIKSNGINEVPESSVYLWDNSTLPDNGVFCDGDYNTPDLRNRYLKGAGTGANADVSSDLGSSTNIHDITHGHTGASHTHTGATDTQSNSNKRDRNVGTPSGNGVLWPHSHTVSLDASTQNVADFSGTLTTTETVEPLYKKLIPVQNKGGADEVVGGIAIWLGSLADIPPGWVLYEAMNGYHLKCANATSETGNTGGSNTHTHAAQSHSHSGSGSHTHTGSVSSHSPADQYIGNGVAPASPYQNHSLSTVSSTTANFDSATTTANSSSNEPEYTEVAFIKHQHDGWTSFVIGNIIRKGEGQANSVKASIVRTESKNNSVKTNIEPYYGQSVAANIQFTYRTKKFYYRIYDGNTFKASWKGEILSTPTFRTVINGGPGEIIIKMDRPFDEFGEDVDMKLNNRVEIWISDREMPTGRKLYSGYISGYRPVLDGSRQYLEVTVLSYITEFSRYILRDASGNTTVTYNSYDPSNMLKAVIDRYRADGGLINYTGDSISLTGTTASYTFNTNTIREALDKIIELCPVGWFWYLDSDNIIHLHSKSDTADHEFRIKKHITYMETWRRVEDLVNRVYFTGAGDPPLYKVFENSGSISAYGLYAKKVVDQRVSLDATAQLIAERNMRPEPEIRTRVTVLDSNGQQSTWGYDIESINVGDTMKIVGLKDGAKTISYWDQMEWDVDVWDQTLSTSATDIIQILSVTYHPNHIEIEASSRLPEIPKRIEDINRNLENSQTVNNPSAPV